MKLQFLALSFVSSLSIFANANIKYTCNGKISADTKVSIEAVIMPSTKWDDITEKEKEDQSKSTAVVTKTSIYKDASGKNAQLVEKKVLSVTKKAMGSLTDSTTFSLRDEQGHDYTYYTVELAPKTSEGDQKNGLAIYVENSSVDGLGDFQQATALDCKIESAR
jgi:hypothetical protein